MKVLALHPGHNATAGLFKEGVCLEYHHEERFSDLKNHTGFPYLALDHIMKSHGPDDVARVLVPDEGIMPYLMEKPSQKYDYDEPPAARRVARLRAFLNRFGMLLPLRLKLVLRQRLRDRFFQQTHGLLREVLRRHNLGEVPFEFFDHHTCHALTPLMFYGFHASAEKTLLITADGAGGDACSKIFLFDPSTGRYEKIAHSLYTASLGHLYSSTTKYLGMKAGEHEYKVMGLAAYSTDAKYWRHITQALDKIVSVDPETLTLQAALDMTDSMGALKQIFAMERFDNVAAAVQDVLERRILELTQAAVRKTGVRNVAFSGGVFMNVKMNSKLTALPEVDRVYFQPSCGDESLGIGGAAQTLLRAGQPLTPIRTMYLGCDVVDAEVEKALESVRGQGVKIERVSDMEQTIAKLLADQEIVARFDGRGEWGARSLCNRAILANASNMQSFFMVNDMVKMRDFWMPFAPTILFEWGERYIADWPLYLRKANASSRYMILTMESTPLAQEHLRAAMHQKDKTLRPQMLEQNDNPKMYKILKAFEQLTGMGGVMNTSFNLHGYPLVGTPERAVWTFLNSGLKRLALGPYLVSKTPGH